MLGKPLQQRECIFVGFDGLSLYKNSDRQYKIGIAIISCAWGYNNTIITSVSPPMLYNAVWDSGMIDGLAAVATSGSYNDLSNTPIIPSIPASESTDGTYVLAETISSGSATRSWQTMPSGGGTTYTAGTGISISNGVISLALANAS